MKEVKEEVYNSATFLWPVYRTALVRGSVCYGLIDSELTWQSCGYTLYSTARHLASKSHMCTCMCIWNEIRHHFPPSFPSPPLYYLFLCLDYGLSADILLAFFMLLGYRLYRSYASPRVHNKSMCMYM